MAAALDGPGIYDRECTLAREAAGAQGAVLIIFRGARGPGFEVQGPLEMMLALPRVLRDLADAVEKNLARSAS